MNDAIKLLPKRLRIKYYAFTTAFNAFIFLFVFAFAILLNKPMGALLVLVAYRILRYKFSASFHHKNTYWCAFWSILGTWVCIIMMLPLSTSIFSTIVVALIFCYVLYKVQTAIDNKKRLEKTITKYEKLQIDNEKLLTANQELLNAQPKGFSLKTCSEEELRTRCRELGISMDSTEIAVEYFVNKSSNIWKLAVKYSIDYDSMKRRIHRIKKKLEA